MRNKSARNAYEQQTKSNSDLSDSTDQKLTEKLGNSPSLEKPGAKNNKASQKANGRSKGLIHCSRPASKLVQTLAQSSMGDFPESSDCKSNQFYNNYLHVERGQQIELNSETNIYLDEPPEEPKLTKRKRLFKTVHHANDKGFDYQEVNSDGQSIGGKLSRLPKDSETNYSGKHSKRSFAQEDGTKLAENTQSSLQQVGATTNKLP